jgi:hypothetical protein
MTIMATINTAMEVYEVHQRLVLPYGRLVLRRSNLGGAVRCYTEHGRKMNRVITRLCRRFDHDLEELLAYLRSPEAQKEAWPVPEAWNAAVELIDALLDKDALLPESLMTFRGISLPEGEAFHVATCGFVSVTLDIGVAWSYAQESLRRRGGFANIIGILVDAGYPALYVPAVIPENEDFELILPPGSFHSPSVVLKS